MERPAELYVPSPRPYHVLPELSYPFHDKEILVIACGRLCLHRKKINLSTVRAGQTVGIKEIDDGIWLASFMHYEILATSTWRSAPCNLDNPFGPRLSPMSQLRSVTHVSGSDIA